MSVKKTCNMYISRFITTLLHFRHIYFPRTSGPPDSSNWVSIWNNVLVLPPFLLRKAKFFVCNLLIVPGVQYVFDLEELAYELVHDNLRHKRLRTPTKITHAFSPFQILWRFPNSAAATSSLPFIKRHVWCPLHIVLALDQSAANIPYCCCAIADRKLNFI